MPKLQLTQQFVDNPPIVQHKTKTDYFDTRLTGFFLEVRATGKATYYQRYRDKHRRNRQARIGPADAMSLEEAREAARQVRSSITNGFDPNGLARKQREVPIFKDFVENQYLPMVMKGKIMTTKLLSTEEPQTETVRFEEQEGTLVPHNSTDDAMPFIQRAADDFGVKNKYSAAMLLSQLSSAGKKFIPPNLEIINGLIAAVKEMNPQGPAESMLAVQMVTCHTKIMTLMEQTIDENLLPETREQCLKLADRLMRTFSRQLEVLPAYRRKGKQSMVVKHVTVQEGGQAIVGNLGDWEGR